MATHTHRFKCIVTALGVTLLSALPLGAQQKGLDTLYQELLEADEQSHARIADEIENMLERSGSPAMDLLLRRGNDALEADEAGIAVEHFTALIDHAPDFAESYAGRASAYYALGLVGPALDDLRQVLALEPRHFDAMFGVGVMMEELGLMEDARAVYAAILAIYPLSPDALARRDYLNLLLEGQAL